ncbi:hypothetical protein QBC47DRAFT_135754 [Echria macrotheca]|uniref:Uncharacterized protein n=1 Tax=Echria macrotheca TaxID=438768 RepID=A0AAJ0BJC0_9PEZI|nr:hypothetical protein QBC47DRAFT_135754 [Echria macrotheca]
MPWEKNIDASDDSRRSSSSGFPHSQIPRSPLGYANLRSPDPCPGTKRNAQRRLRDRDLSLAVLDRGHTCTSLHRDRGAEITGRLSVLVADYKNGRLGWGEGAEARMNDFVKFSRVETCKRGARAARVALPFLPGPPRAEHTQPTPFAPTTTQIQLASWQPSLSRCIEPAASLRAALQLSLLSVRPSSNPSNPFHVPRFSFRLFIGL